MEQRTQMVYINWNLKEGGLCHSFLPSSFGTHWKNSRVFYQINKNYSNGESEICFQHSCRMFLLVCARVTKFIAFRLIIQYLKCHHITHTETTCDYFVSFILLVHFFPLSIPIWTSAQKIHSTWSFHSHNFFVCHTRKTILDSLHSRLHHSILWDE